MIANDFSDLWDSSIRTPINLTEKGEQWVHWPFTGSYWDGTKAPGHGSSSYRAMGDGGAIHQGQASDASNWVWRVKNLTDGSEILIPVGDSRLSVDGVVLSIDPGAALQWDKAYAVRIEANVVDSHHGARFAGNCR